MINEQEVMERANEIFREKVARDNPYTAPELLPESIPSRQVRALCKALVEAFNTEMEGAKP